MCALSQSDGFRLLFPQGLRAKERYMAFFWASIDESADRERKYAYVVTGLLSRQDLWTEFERLWNRRLHKDSLDYFKTSEHRDLSGEFKRFKDRDAFPRPSGRVAADNVRDDLSLMIRSSRMMGVSLAIDLRDYRAVRKSSRSRIVLPSNPYRFAYQMLMIYIAGELSKKIKSPGPIAFLCDSDNNSNLIKKTYDRLREDNPGCNPFMGSITFKDDKKVPAIQAADLIAGFSRKYAVGKLKGEDSAALSKEFRKQVGRYIEIGILDKKFFKLVAEANLLANGKPSIRSTKQLGLFHDILKGEYPPD